MVTGGWRITFAGSRSSLVLSIFVVTSFAPLLAKESIEFLEWEQEVAKASVRLEQAPCYQSVHSWNRQAAQIGRGGFQFESADDFSLSRPGSELLSSALLGAPSFLHETQPCS